MIPRCLAALLVSISLLFAAGTAVACGVQTPMDCCPGDTPPACPDQPDPTSLPVSTGFCCAAAPALAATTAQAYKAPLFAADNKSAALFPVISDAPFFRFTTMRAGPGLSDAGYLPDASLTYLRTARLRI